MNAPRRIHPVILSGGAGTRLWPLSRAHYPKQFLPLVGERTMIQETVLRVGADDLFHLPIVIANDAHRFIVAEQFRALGAPTRANVLEPVGRNTAPAAAVAALLLRDEDPDAIMALLPSDHVIGDQAVFEAAIELAAEASARDALITFGIPLSRPETGYGYIRRGGPMEGAVGCFEIERFVEKPDAATAEAYFASGDYLWNSGMFVFRVARYLDELTRLRPEIVRQCETALAKARDDLDFLRLDAEAFAEAPADSIDYAVMEHTDSAGVIPVEMGWSDVGEWAALWEIGEADGDGNVARGDVVLDDVRGSYVHAAAGRIVVAHGVEDLVIVATEDAIVVADRAKAAGIKDIVARLTADGRDEVVAHRRVYRPWGYYQDIDSGDRFRAKRIVVNPGASLSLQRHRQRAEHWVVVRGTARVTRGEQVTDLSPDQSTYIPLGEIHRLANPGTDPLHLIEVQTGDYLGEDDIERLEDDYGR